MNTRLNIFGRLKAIAFLSLLLIITNNRIQGQCLTNQLTVNTGYNPATGGTYATGTQDQYWTVTYISPGNLPFAAGLVPFQAFVNVPNGSYVTNANSQWISFLSNPSYSAPANSNDSTYYMTLTRKFRTCMADSITFNLQHAADNWLSSIFVDGVMYYYDPPPAVPLVSAFNVFHPITAFTIYLAPGLHNIDANVFNYPSGGFNPIGFNMLGSLTGAQSSLIKDTCTNITTSISVSPLTDTICAGESIVITATGANTYSWSPGTGLDTTSGNTVTATPAGTSIYTVTGNTCAGNATVTSTIHVIPYIPVNAGPDTSTCEHNSIKLLANVGAALPPYTISWSPTTYLNSSTNISPVVQNPTATTTYIVTVSKNFGNLVCPSYDTITVNVVPYLTVNAGPDTATCFLKNFLLSASVSASAGTYSVKWSPTTFLSSSTIINPTMQNPNNAVTYIVSVQPLGNVSCPSYDTVRVDLIALFSTDNPDQAMCKGGSVQMSGVDAPGFNYIWAPSRGTTDATTLTPLITPDTTTTYILTGINSKGCILKDTVKLTVFPDPKVYVYGDKNVITCEDKIAQVFASGATSYHWTPGKFFDDSLSASPHVSHFGVKTTFTVEGTDINGCKAWDSIIIDNNMKAHLFMPDAFTPNGDKINDGIHPLVYCDFILDWFYVYDRWGRRVFKARFLTDAWDGTVDGNPAEIGTYFYEIIGHEESGEDVFMKGDFTLIR